MLFRSDVEVPWYDLGGLMGTGASSQNNGTSTKVFPAEAVGTRSSAREKEGRSSAKEHKGSSGAEEPPVLTHHHTELGLQLRPTS